MWTVWEVITGKCCLQYRILKIHACDPKHSGAIYPKKKTNFRTGAKFQSSRTQAAPPYWEYADFDWPPDLFSLIGPGTHITLYKAFTSKLGMDGRGTVQKCQNPFKKSRSKNSNKAKKSKGKVERETGSEIRKIPNKWVTLAEVKCAQTPPGIRS